MYGALIYHEALSFKILHHAVSTVANGNEKGGGGGGGGGGQVP